MSERDYDGKLHAQREALSKMQRKYDTVKGDLRKANADLAAERERAKRALELSRIEGANATRLFEELRVALAEAAQLRAALEPFAALSDEIDDQVPEITLVSHYGHPRRPPTILRVADLRAAALALAGGAGETLTDEERAERERYWGDQYAKCRPYNWGAGETSDEKLCGPACPCGDVTRCGTVDPATLSACPKCGGLVEDLDGFGVLVHDACGYCSHPSVTDDVCDACGGAVESQCDLDAFCVRPAGHSGQCFATRDACHAGETQQRTDEFPLPSPWRTPEQMKWIHDRFKLDGLGRLARSTSDYYESHGNYLPDVAALAHAALTALAVSSGGATQAEQKDGEA